MTVPILPKLKPDDSSVQLPEKGGEWKVYPKATFEDVAKSLDYAAPGENKRINSVPNMWALPMTLEIPIFNNVHPLRQDAIGQWQGMLAAIAFAKIRNFPLVVQRLDIDEVRRRHPFAEALWQLKPDSEKSLYKIDNKEAWQEIYIWTWNGEPVGMTSPTTIVVPAPEGIWSGLPWWNQDDRKLVFPQPYLSDEEKPLFGGWLSNLLRETNNPEYSGHPQTVNNVVGLLGSFQASMGRSASEADIFDQDSPQYFGVALNRGVLKGLNRPIKLKEIGSGDSYVKVVNSPSKTPAKPLILIDAEVATVWGIAPQNIRVHKDKTLASLNIEDLRAGRIAGWDDVRCIEPRDLFLPELTFIDVDDALPGGFPVQSNQPLLFNNNKITPLLPFNPLLLEYFTPEDLMGRVRFMQNGSMVRVVLNLPLAGMNSAANGRPEEYQLVREYTLNEQNAIEDVPVLELWPNLKIPNWQDYYAFYFDANDTFKVSFGDAQEPHTYSDRNGDYIITRLSNFPTHINCQRRGYPVGFILLKTPIEQKLSDTWVVGVDFGTSFTNVYVNRKGKVEPLQLENLHLKITAANVETRQPVLFESFIPEVFVPADKPLPLASVLTRLGATGNEKKKVLYDGRIYVPDRINFHPESNHIETDLKWKDPGKLNRLFLEHLGLMVSALAAKAGVGEIQWSVSYPSAFSRADINAYAKTWKDLTEELQKRTGLKHVCPEPGEKSFRTESLALAQYFADKEDCNLVRSACIDLGGGTSDISIWQANNLIHQCSIQLAGRHLLSQFLEQRPVLIARWFKRPTEEWSDLAEDKFKAKIDSLLRHESERWLKDDRPELEDDKDFQGLIRLMAIGTAGIYYYVGLILGTLTAEGKYTEGKTPSVYIGGNGSRLLHWLDHGGVFTRRSGINELFRRMVADGSDLQETTGSDTQISQRPKDEAACGLVLEKSKLQGLDRKAKDPLIAGENCRINGQNVGFDQRMSADGDDITSIEAPPQLDRLIDFINSFNEGIKDLGIEEEIKPFSQYRKGSGLEAGYSEELFDKTMTELRSTLININNGDGEQLRVEPPFILGLKALMKVLAREWAGK
jgi:hypothetical protein